MAISALGVGSGLDLNALLEQMRAAENKRLVPLQDQQKSLTAQLSAWGTVKSSVSKLQTAAEKLQKANNISLNAVKSDNTAFKATVDAKALSGNYRVEVNQIATADFKSAKVGLGNDFSGTDKLLTVSGEGETINLGSVSIKLDGPKNGETERAYTLNEVRDIINNDKNSHVRAQVINGSDGAYLAFTSKETGAAASIGEVSSSSGISFADGVDTAFLSKLNSQDPDNVAKDAQISINGITVSSSTNTFKNVLDGISITVSAKTTAPETLTISQDTSSLKDALKEYVAAYNEIQDTIKTQTKFVPGKVGQDLSGDNGALMGNNSIRTLQNQLRGQLSSSQDGDFNTLNQLGIRLGSDGKLSIDDKTLDKALADNPDGVVKFMVGDGEKTGFATQSTNQLKQLTNATTGLFKTQENSISAMKRRVEDNIDRTTQSIEASIENMRTQFKQLDKMMSEMSGTSAYLAQQLGSLM